MNVTTFEEVTPSVNHTFPQLDMIQIIFLSKKRCT